MWIQSVSITSHLFKSLGQSCSCLLVVPITAATVDSIQAHLFLILYIHNWINKNLYENALRVPCVFVAVTWQARPTTLRPASRRGLPTLQRRARGWLLVWWPQHQFSRGVGQQPITPSNYRRSAHNKYRLHLYSYYGYQHYCSAYYGSVTLSSWQARPAWRYHELDTSRLYWTICRQWDGLTPSWCLYLEHKWA